MTDLIKRLEKADAGSLELDVAIWDATGGWSVAHPPAFTTSLDAALALAERLLDGDFVYDLSHGFGGLNDAKLHGITDRPVWGEAQANTMPLALCIAILKATDTGREG